MPQLSDRLLRETSARGLDPRLISLPSAAAVLLLGLGQDQPRALDHLARTANPAETICAVLSAAAAERTYLSGHLNPFDPAR